MRFFILRAHYRSALNYSDTHLDDAKRSLDSLYFALRDVPPVAPQGDLSPRPRRLPGVVDGGKWAKIRAACAALTFFQRARP